MKKAQEQPAATMGPGGDGIPAHKEDESKSFATVDVWGEEGEQRGGEGGPGKVQEEQPAATMGGGDGITEGHRALMRQVQAHIEAETSARKRESTGMDHEDPMKKAQEQPAAAMGSGGDGMIPEDCRVLMRQVQDPTKNSLLKSPGKNFLQKLGPPLV